MGRSLIGTLAAALVGGAALLATPAGAQTLQWQTANLTEKQFEPVWKQMIAEFEAANPGVKIEPVLVARKDHWTKFVTASQARRAPCLVSVDVTTAAYNGYLMPLDTYWKAEPEAWRNAWSDAALGGARWKGALYGVPIWAGIYGEVYNRDLVKAAGLDPANPPKTWAEYLAWAKKLTSPDRWATALLGGRTDTTTRVLLTWIWSNDGEPFNADMTESRFAKDAKSLEAIKFYIGLMREGVTAPGATTTNYLEQTNLFAQGKIATMRNAYWAVAKVAGDNPAMANAMFAAPIPTNAPDGMTLAGQTSTSIAAGCAHPDIAWKFIKFEAEAKWSVMRAKVANWLPVRGDLAGSPDLKDDAMLRAFVSFGRKARGYPLPHPLWADIAAGDLVDAVQKAMLAPDTVEAVFKDLDTRLTKKLNDL